MNVARLLKLALLGVGLGASLGAVGFSDFGEVHRMFLLQDLRLMAVFATAVGLTWLGYRLLRPFAKGRKMPTRSFHPGLVPGGVLFGLGWALTGACPAASLVQLGEGKLPAVFTAAGILLGARLATVLDRQWLHWDGACGVPT